MLKLRLLLILHAVKNKVEIRAKKRWYYHYLSARIAEGFTLAEVLITLLIIGIVASIVIPAIIHDIQDAELKTAYKKAFAVASQVVKQCYSESLFEPRASYQDGAANGNNFDVFMTKFSVQKQCINNNNPKCWDSTGETTNGGPYSKVHAFIDSSGVSWSARCLSDSHISGCTSYMLLVDTNGFKQPNKYGRDRWTLWLLDKDNQITGVPVKVAIPDNQDFTTTNNMSCPTPPCYYKSWLIQ